MDAVSHEENWLVPRKCKVIGLGQKGISCSRSLYLNLSKKEGAVETPRTVDNPRYRQHSG